MNALQSLNKLCASAPLVLNNDLALWYPGVDLEHARPVMDYGIG